ncbi:leucine-rich repeat protein FLOR 1-like [Aegilops tauschii subsp. strangulata]|uniref:Leucine-rich repeat-containing N-terminal plant-type domain-containing protein n=1 Tax=Aegilops tauschii subsp. strangulata TaxID=200361 RepID=A0A453D0K6_AEGTS|nr:polygalacturonase inhibitor-like [Aegilops tauschii subsp. strangulata]
MRASSLVEHCATVVAVVLLAAAAAAAAARTKDECHSGDKAALLAIKSAFGNASYFNSWTPDTPCCEWANVSCDGSASPYTARRVVGVSLVNDASLAGPLPGTAIARLTALQQLVLNYVPGVNGSIPRDLTRLNATLSFLDIISTGISGPVPSFLSEITALSYLSLSSNKLTGSIPASLADMPNLYFLDLGYNRLTGTIPPQLLRKGSYLYLSHNKLTGSVPAEFAAVNFWTIDLSYNGFKGDASFLLGANKPLLNLDLSHNAFSFNLSGVQLPEGLNSLELSHNEIYGDIPEMVVDMMLNYLNVSYNRLSGVVPAGGNMAWFDQSCFQHNKGLCGSPLPPCKQ